jgi:hypothetical protein
MKIKNKKYDSILKKMSYEEKALKMFELSEYSKKLLWFGLKNKFSELHETELKKIYIERLIKCHNRNY